MRFHDSVVEKLIKMVEVWGGHREETKLRAELKKLQLDVYERKVDGEKIIVMQEDVKR